MKSSNIEKISNQSIRDQVYHQLQNAILDGVFPAGTRLNLNNLITKFGVSKTPLTEAIQKLVREGLISVKPRSGTFVSKLGAEQVKESFGLRRAIEIGSADMIIEQITDAEVNLLANLHNQMEKLLSGSLKRDSISDFIHLDTKFHDSIVAASGNKLIIDHYKQVNTQLMVLRIRTLYQVDQLLEAHDQHKQIIETLKNRNIEAFIKESKKHLLSGEQKMKAYV